MKTLIKNIQVSVLITSCLIVPAIAFSAESTPVVVEIDSAKQQEIASQIWVSGTVVSKYDAMIASQVSGNITWVAEVGDNIKAGGVIAKIDDYELKLQEKTRRAEVERLKAKSVYLDRQLERFKSLATTSNTSVSTLDQTISEKMMLEQELIMAETELEKILYDIKCSHVIAPFSGVIVERLQTPGEFAEEGKVVARLVNTTDLEVSAKAPLAVSRFAKKNSQVIVRGEYSEEFTPVRSFIPVGDERSRMIEVRIPINSANWVIGEAVRVSLDNAKAVSLVAVPRDALVLREDVVYLFKVGNDNIAQKIVVKTGAGDGSYIFVEGNVNKDDKVIVRGAERLKDGQSVKIVKKSVATI